MSFCIIVYTNPPGGGGLLAAQGLYCLTDTVQDVGLFKLFLNDQGLYMRVDNLKHS